MSGLPASAHEGEAITWKVTGPLARIELARPDKGNALDEALVDSLRGALGEIAALGCAALSIEGRGRHLCTGFDLSGLEAATEAGLLCRFVRIELMLAQVWNAPCATAALGAGRTWGAGADLLCAAEHRWALPDATFRFPGAQFGIVLGTRRLAERVGSQAARRWVLGNEEIDAPTALSAGLLTRIGTVEEYRAFTEALAARPAPEAATADRIRAITRGSDADADLAELVRSAERSGLRERILAYRDAARRKAVRPG